MDLSGRWRVAPLTPELNRVGVDPDLDDDDWFEVDVPGHWDQNPGLPTTDGPVIYRRSFTHRSPRRNERFWLDLEGVLSTAEVWLDGSYLGDTVGYFAPNRFEITEPLTRRSDHLLAVDVACPPGGSSRGKATLTGSLQSGPLAPGNNPGGIWKPVKVAATGPVAIRYARLLCTDAGPTRAVIQVRIVVDSVDGLDATVITTVTGPDGAPAATDSRIHTVAAGENRIEWNLAIDDPELWWPTALADGDDRRPLYRVAVDIETDRPVGGTAGRPSDRVEWATGLRTVEMDDLQCRVNGRRLFCKSVAYGPSDPHLAAVDPERLRSDVRAIKAAGCDMVRVYGHVTRSEFYEEADRVGLLVWQDMPLVGGYTSKVRSRIRSVARALVDQLGHHPSVAIWSGHCEPNEVVDATVDDGTDLAKLTGVGAGFIRQLLPTWNRSLLDPLIGRELSNADPTRTVLSRSGNLPTPGHTSDTNLWLGWRVGRPQDLPTIARRWPRVSLFPGGIGTQSASASREVDGPDWPGAETASFNRYLPRSAYANGRSWVAATHAYQADALRIQIESLRRLKYRPTGGFCVMAWADTHPGGGFGVVDFDQTPKAAHEVLIDACRPVIVVAEPAPTVTVPDEEISLAVHAVSDLRRSLRSVTVTATARRPGWHRSTRWAGDLEADSCQRIGDFVFTVPTEPGPLVIDLTLESADLAVSNRYRTVVIPQAEALSPRPWQQRT